MLVNDWKWDILFLSSNRWIVFDQLFFKLAAHFWKTCHKIGLNMFFCVFHWSVGILLTVCLCFWSLRREQVWLPPCICQSTCWGTQIPLLSGYVSQGNRARLVRLKTHNCLSERARAWWWGLLIDSSCLFRGTTMQRAFLFLQRFLPQFPEVGCTCLPLLSRQPHHLLCDDLPAAC